MQKRLGYRFSSQELLLTALTHPSYANERGIADYERLEFLGDTVLQLVVTRHLFREYSHLREGQMTRVRAEVVRKETLAELASALGVGEALRLGKGEIQTGGRDRTSILADAMEAIIGAVYEDGGWKSVRRLVMRHWREMVSDQAAMPDARDAKTRLQEVLAAEDKAPEYRRSEEGPAHARRFRVEVWVVDAAWAEPTVARDQTCQGVGEGRSRRLAEQRAAAEALDNLYPDSTRAQSRPLPSVSPHSPPEEPPIMQRIRDWGNRRSAQRS